MLRIARDLIDQQIIDAQGRKVVRVNDAPSKSARRATTIRWHVIDVDIGLRSILRRVLQGAVPPRSIRWAQRIFDSSSIRWELV